MSPELHTHFLLTMSPRGSVASHTQSSSHSGRMRTPRKEPARPHTSFSPLSLLGTTALAIHVLLRSGQGPPLPTAATVPCLTQLPSSCFLGSPPNKLPAPTFLPQTDFQGTPNPGIQLEKISHCGHFFAPNSHPANLSRIYPFTKRYSLKISASS